MSFLNKLANLFVPSPRSEEFAYRFQVKCNRCGEIIPGRVDLRNEPSAIFDEHGKKTFFCRKVLMGDSLCFQKIEVEFTFDTKYNIIERKIQGGTFFENDEVINS